jgi:AcrR family transcriptional regulator
VSESQSPQRRRSESARRAILDATLSLVREKGLAALTVEGIAARAGVGKQTIYRWWPSKGLVAVDALLETAGSEIELAHGPDIWTDLAELLGNVAEMMTDPDRGPHWAAVLAQAQSDPALAEAFHLRVFGPIRSAYRSRLEQARRTGALTADPDDLLDMAFGPLWFRLLTRPQQMTREFGVRVARQLEQGIDAGERGKINRAGTA